MFFLSPSNSANYVACISVNVLERPLQEEVVFFVASDNINWERVRFLCKCAPADLQKCCESKTFQTSDPIEAGTG